MALLIFIEVRPKRSKEIFPLASAITPAIVSLSPNETVNVTASVGRRTGQTFPPEGGGPPN